MSRCSCGFPAIQCRRNSSRLRQNPNWVVVAHGDHFETAIEQHIMAPRFGWPEIPLERHTARWPWRRRSDCRRGLSAAADALELANRKDVAGERLMHQMSKPRRARQGEDPAKFIGLTTMNVCDGFTTIAGRTSRSNVSCLIGCRCCRRRNMTLWALSCRINERGFCVDRQFAEAARRIAQAAAPEIDAELAELTGGAVTGINQVARLLEWLQQQGCTAKKLDRKAIERQLEKRRLAAGGAAGARASARRCAGRRQEDRRAACARRRRQSCARRLSLSRRIHRPLGR